MKFHFPFQKLLDVKEKEKEFAQQEFGDVKSRQMEIEELLEGLKLEKQMVFEQYNDVQGKTVHQILEYQQELEHVNRQMKQLEEHSIQLKMEVEEKQQILIDKSKETKIWNQWKGKARDAFVKEVERKEQSVLDEMAVLRYSRRV